jgi:hypothetical protein
MAFPLATTYCCYYLTYGHPLWHQIELDCWATQAESGIYERLIALEILILLFHLSIRPASPRSVQLPLLSPPLLTNVVIRAPFA